MLPDTSGDDDVMLHVLCLPIQLFDGLLWLHRLTFSAGLKRERVCRLPFPDVTEPCFARRMLDEGHKRSHV